MRTAEQLQNQCKSKMDRIIFLCVVLFISCTQTIEYKDKYDEFYQTFSYNDEVYTIPILYPYYVYFVNPKNPGYVLKNDTIKHITSYNIGSVNIQGVKYVNIYSDSFLYCLSCNLGKEFDSISDTDCVFTLIDIKRDTSIKVKSQNKFDQLLKENHLPKLHWYSLDSVFCSIIEGGKLPWKSEYPLEYRRPNGNVCKAKRYKWLE